MAHTNPYLPKPYTVLSYHRETPDTITITIDMAVKHEAGQFVQVSLPGIGEAPISIASFAQDHLQLSIREIGNLTKALGQLKVGDTVLVRGPYGKGYPMKQLTGNSVVIVGGGCGVAPLRGIIEYIEKNRQDYREVYLFLGYRSPSDILFSRELEEWKSKYNLQVTVDNKPQEACYNGKQGFITDALKAANFDNSNKVVFLCGPPIMMKTATSILADKGFHDDQIFVSTERLMYCAVGACCHCMIKGKYTCIDGPVFRYDQIKAYTND